MAVIQRRIVFVDNSVSGVIRFSDWAAVKTPIGYMVEPGFIVNNRHPIGIDMTDFDPTDEMNRIDDIQFIDMLQEKTVLSGGTALHGGPCMPRVGK